MTNLNEFYGPHRYWFDTEFIEDGKTIDLLSIGIVCGDGREFYAVNYEADRTKASPWVVENVLPHLDMPGAAVGPRRMIAGVLRDFVRRAPKPELWAYYADYDWVVLCQLFGTMMDLPPAWPMFAMDVKQLCMSMGNPKLPEQTSTEHNALEDARWTRDAWLWLLERGQAEVAHSAELDAP